MTCDVHTYLIADLWVQEWSCYLTTLRCFQSGSFLRCGCFAPFWGTWQQKGRGPGRRHSRGSQETMLQYQSNKPCPHGSYSKQHVFVKKACSNRTTAIMTTIGLGYIDFFLCAAETSNWPHWTWWRWRSDWFHPGVAPTTSSTRKFISASWYLIIYTYIYIILTYIYIYIIIYTYIYNYIYNMI